MHPIPFVYIYVTNPFWGDSGLATDLFLLPSCIPPYICWTLHPMGQRYGVPNGSWHIMVRGAPNRRMLGAILATLGGSTRVSLSDGSSGNGQRMSRSWKHVRFTKTRKVRPATRAPETFASQSFSSQFCLAVVSISFELYIYSLDPSKQLPATWLSISQVLTPAFRN